jgi:hypothetical protein
VPLTSEGTVSRFLRLIAASALELVIPAMIVALVALSTASASVSAQGSGARSVGTVVYDELGCDYFIVETASGYALLQWFGGVIPMRGDVVVGAFETFGMPEIYNRTQGSSMTVWADDYWMSRPQVIQRIRDHCLR